MENMQTDASVKGITVVYQQFSLETFSMEKKGKYLISSRGPLRMATDPNVHICSNSNVTRKLYILLVLEYVISS